MRKFQAKMEVRFRTLAFFQDLEKRALLVSKPRFVRSVFFLLKIFKVLKGETAVSVDSLAVEVNAAMAENILPSR